MKKLVHLVLADGFLFKGSAFIETDDVVTGELVFSTSMCGYTEILTDPSYYGQIVVLANPEIGNYGVNVDDFQSNGIKVKALVVRNVSSCASSFRAQMTLVDWLRSEKIPLLWGMDTRAIISHIRNQGVMMAALSANPNQKPIELYDHARTTETMEGKRLSGYVSVKKAEPFQLKDVHRASMPRHPESQFHVVVMDFGVKYSILRYLSHHKARLTLVPGGSSPEEIWKLLPDGLFLSNGPGDPKTEKNAVDTVRSLLGELPIFGVCLGHQILAQAIGLSTYKLKFGHRGSNQPVKCADKRIITTAQNHGFAVESKHELRLDEDSNISDGTNEGIYLPHLNAFSVQFHPEGAPGPHDGLFYFEKFMESIAQNYARHDVEPEAWPSRKNNDGRNT